MIYYLNVRDFIQSKPFVKWKFKKISFNNLFKLAMDTHLTTNTHMQTYTHTHTHTHTHTRYTQTDIPQL